MWRYSENINEATASTALDAQLKTCSAKHGHSHKTTHHPSPLQLHPHQGLCHKALLEAHSYQITHQV